MNHSAFKIVYANGYEFTTYAFNFRDAIILGMAHALNQGWNIDIHHVIEGREMAKNIQPPTFKMV